MTHFERCIDYIMQYLKEDLVGHQLFKGRYLPGYQRGAASFLHSVFFLPNVRRIVPELLSVKFCQSLSYRVCTIPFARYFLLLVLIHLDNELTFYLIIGKDHKPCWRIKVSKSSFGLTERGLNICIDPYRLVLWELTGTWSTKRMNASHLCHDKEGCCEPTHLVLESALFNQKRKPCANNLRSGCATTCSCVHKPSCLY